jgi:hypothetical protein
MGLSVIGGIGLLVGIALPLGEAWYERDWPRSTVWGSLCLIALSLLCLSYSL